jgi:hypothetical protein
MADAIEAAWPDGAAKAFEHIESDQFLVIDEAAGIQAD